MDLKIFYSEKPQDVNIYVRIDRIQETVVSIFSQIYQPVKFWGLVILLRTPMQTQTQLGFGDSNVNELKLEENKSLSSGQDQPGLRKTNGKEQFNRKKKFVSSSKLLEKRFSEL